MMDCACAGTWREGGRNRSRKASGGGREGERGFGGGGWGVGRGERWQKEWGRAKKRTDRTKTSARARGALSPAAGRAVAGRGSKCSGSPFSLRATADEPRLRQEGTDGHGRDLCWRAGRGAARRRAPPRLTGGWGGPGQASYAYFHPADMYEVNRAHYGILTQVRARRAGTLRQWSS